ncbi:hypothetical protein F5984_24975 [Rudanella paleaurantiibacter]|uniref:Tetratricopeptide repeat protein n=1 Tax=Rudanella paleaurantiibacter TaxID=2614655 RepID=A0A7J5TSC9_9BACT|nr:hypothetical protein [Rudanella paleaurantiibacter]KAB7726134.1 hypothetical protein F5984_24975 [Rudanella paleaurantiibacter]
MELLITFAIISYIIYLRYYADLRTSADKERSLLQPGIDLYNTNQLDRAMQYFSQRIEEQPRLSVAYLYRARCLRELGDSDAALADLQTGASYDNSVADIHLETGRILYDRRAFDAAFSAFDQAVFYAKGQDPMAYYWRGLARQQLGQAEEAQLDAERATTLEHAQSVGNVPGQEPQPSAFLDRRLAINALFVLLHSVVLLYVVKQSPVIHWPYLMASISAAAIGFAEPRRGWLLALLQASALLIGYYGFTDQPAQSGQKELEAFNLFGSVGLTFVGSFIGSILKRSMISH